MKLKDENKALQSQRDVISARNRDLQQELALKQVAIEEMANRSVKITLQNAVMFSSGSYKLTREGQIILDKVVPTMRQYQDKKRIRVQWHTDSLPVTSKTEGYKDN